MIGITNRKKVLWKTVVTENLTNDQVKRLNEITSGWPNVERINHRLALYLTDALPADKSGYTLLSTTVGKAIDAWDRGETFNDLLNYGAYINEILKALPEVYRFQVFTPYALDENGDGGEVWDPLIEGLDSWYRRLKSEDSVVVTYSHFGPPAADRYTLRRILSSHVLYSRDLRVLSEYINDIFSDEFMVNEIDREVNFCAAIE